MAKDAADIDILVLGATGFTGKLVSRYLAVHPAYTLCFAALHPSASTNPPKPFKFALGARSKERLDALAEELSLTEEQVPRLVVDTANDENVRAAVKRTKVVINTVGPYAKHSTGVVAECAKTGTHYVDISGEPIWTYQLLQQFDSLALQTGAVIVPSCGFDSLPADLSVFLSIQKLKSELGPEAQATESINFYSLYGGCSGGTLSTIMTIAEESDPELLKKTASEGYYLSPVQGTQPSFHKTRTSRELDLVGGFFPMSGVNRPNVHRTWGLKQLESKEAAYGENFSYEEYLALPGKLTAAITSRILKFAMRSLGFAPVRWSVRKFGLKSGEGPSEEKMFKGFFKIVNITTSDSTPPIHVKSEQKGAGDPGYLLTPVMVSECALLLLKPSTLTPAAQKGGMLTPVTAFGTQLVDSLEKTGKWSFSTEVVIPVKEKKKKK